MKQKKALPLEVPRLQASMMITTDGIKTECIHYDHDALTSYIPINNIEDLKAAVERMILLQQLRNGTGNFSGISEEITEKQDKLIHLLENDSIKG